ncbi:hypothetical protein AAP_05204 [Ascosphaera apis ARSEF 7405]|uniref:Uncharacterized protein n=1 Tax=Ascosphaera apis ARSEF 7405 TaxID=392613 RepID=A0A167VXI0_9EURO|nr:hypothetical protein AAP_05204 [Ascosphaera apis ARSEF 7405]
MFSHFVSAARGLFGSPNPNPHAEVEHHNSNQEQDTDASSPLKKEDRSKMVNTRRTTFDAVDAESPAVAQSNNKSTRAGKNKKTQDKDRTPKTPKMGDKKKSRQQEINDDENDDNVEEEQSTPSVPVKEKKETETAKSSHVRFGSEDPEEPSEQLLQEEESATVAAKDEEQEQDEESSDDEAPEAVGKDAALETIKEAARKEAEAKKRYVFYHFVS